MYHFQLAILLLAFVCVSAKPLVHSAAFVEPFAPAVVTATSSQYVARNYNSFAAPLVAANYVASPYYASPYVASPYAYSYPYVL